MEKLMKLLVKVIALFSMLAITGLTLIVFLQVVFRFSGVSWPGAEELSRLLIVWLTFLGSSLAIYEKMHLGVRYFVSLAKPSIQLIIDRFVYLLIFIFFLLLTFYGMKLTINAMDNTSSTLLLPMSVFYAAIPLSSIFSMLFVIEAVLNPERKGAEEL